MQIQQEILPLKFQGGCGEASEWGAEPVEPGTSCSLRMPTETVFIGR
jgi:hypothetical protein